MVRTSHKARCVENENNAHSLVSKNSRREGGPPSFQRAPCPGIWQKHTQWDITTATTFPKEHQVPCTLCFHIPHFCILSFFFFFCFFLMANSVHRIPLLSISSRNGQNIINTRKKVIDWKERPKERKRYSFIPLPWKWRRVPRRETEDSSMVLLRL